MKMPAEVREGFRRHGSEGGRRRAAAMSAAERRAVARRGATARWIRRRFGAGTLERAGLPGGEIVDAGLADLAHGKVTIPSLLVSLAAPRLRREGVPVGPPLASPEDRLYALVERESGDLAHARYGAYLRRMVSFADACRTARVDGKSRAK